jgi:hypothetical protein
MLIKIERYFKYPDLKRQTPGSSFKWKDFTFTEDNVEECDYLVILDYPKNDFTVKVNKENIIHLALEPANEVSKYRQYSNKKVKNIYNQFNTKNNNVLSHGALPWHIDKDFDFLNDLKSEDTEKEDKIVWITSNQKTSKGHTERMNYLERIKDLPFVELYGRGIKPIDSKWEVLKNAKYAIAYENSQNDYYWTEKIVDCFLSYSMPIYFGCNSIDNFFPKDSYIQLDPNDKHSALFLKEIVKSNKWKENLNPISIARQLVLNEYQLFPFLYNQIQALEVVNGKYKTHKKDLISFKGQNDFFDNYPMSVMLEKNIAKFKRKLNL